MKELTMIDLETFLTTLYVMADDFCQSQAEPETDRRGPQPALSVAEVVTLSLFGQWANFASERAFYRYAERHLREAFPDLPARSQFNRVQRTYAEAIMAFGLFLVELTDAQCCHYERIDSSGIATRDSKRRGDGWLAGQADIGWSNRLGWYEGFHLLVCIAQEGMITGYGFGPASTHDHPLMETFLFARAQPTKELSSVGKKAQGPIL
jgi:hypothetical protein